MILKYMDKRYSKSNIHFMHVCVNILLLPNSAQFNHAIGTYKMHPNNQIFPHLVKFFGEKWLSLQQIKIW
jgi:hypothetical protein